MGKYHWKVEKQPEWYVKAVRKTIAALPGGYAEAAEWLDVTENALFNRLRADGDQIFPLGWAMVLRARLALTTLRMLSHSLLVGCLYRFLKLRK